MGKVTKKVLGTSRGRVGDIVMRKWRTDIVSASYQPHPSNPNTEAQQEVRAKFRAMSKTATNMAAAISQTLRYPCKGTNLSPRNLFIRLNKAEGWEQDGMNITEKPATWKVAKGRNAPLTVSSLDFDNPSEIGIENIGFEPGSIPAAAVGHIRYDVVVYCSDAEVSLLSRLAANATSATIAVPSNWNGLKCHVWLCPYWSGDTVAEVGMEDGATFASLYMGSGTIS